jgi:hypothetical protein
MIRGQSEQIIHNRNPAPNSEITIAKLDWRCGSSGTVPDLQACGSKTTGSVVCNPES